MGLVGVAVGCVGNPVPRCTPSLDAPLAIVIPQEIEQKSSGGWWGKFNIMCEDAAHKLDKAFDSATNKVMKVVRAQGTGYVSYGTSAAAKGFRSIHQCTCNECRG